jgi:hypothetical protein
MQNFIDFMDVAGTHREAIPGIFSDDPKAENGTMASLASSEDVAGHFALVCKHFPGLVFVPAQVQFHRTDRWPPAGQWHPRHSPFLQTHEAVIKFVEPFYNLPA